MDTQVEEPFIAMAISRRFQQKNQPVNGSTRLETKVIEN